MKKSVRDIDVAGKRVLVRVDFNVPFDRTGAIADDSRIRAALPTIQYLQDQNAKVILCSHLGRPDGKVVESMRLTPVAERLSSLLGQPVKTTRDCVGAEAEAAALTLSQRGVLLLENLRFHAEEEANDPAFAQALAVLAEVYVNDAFGTAHRAHASTAGVAAYLPAVAGFLMLKEIEELGNILTNPTRPVAAILGGAKISSKVAVLMNLLPRVDCLLLGGGIASTFLKARGASVGDSLVEDDFLDTARRVLSDAEQRGVPVLLPTDVVVADAFSADANHKTVAVGAIESGWRAMDIGPDTLSTYRDALDDCQTIFWNGPLGVAEFPAFAEGSLALALALADIDGRVVIGGGETSAIVEQAGLHDRYAHVSTGGGASLEFIEGKTLPGVAALNDKLE
ncbi:MAG TPA: phosphoglycerate kinase [Dehalococcoidia bacterium]|nr:phosphoglycerate kinase [Dehalococcoidia bacterium]